MRRLLPLGISHGSALCLWLAVSSSTNAQVSKAPITAVPIPPSAVQASIELNETGEEAIITATFGAQSNLRAELNFNYWSPAIALRDDGQPPDAVAGDGVYTGKITLSQSERASVMRTMSALKASAETENKFALAGRFVERRAVLQGRSIVDSRVDRTGPGLGVRRLNLKALGPGTRVNFADSLFITKTAVVDDPTRTFDLQGNHGSPDGKWTFKHLMEQLVAAHVDSSGKAIDPSINLDVNTFTEQWLETWEKDQTINNELVPARSEIKDLIIDPWKKRENGKIDLKTAPFRLMAIINRIDLAGNTLSLPTGRLIRGNAGEARFIFCALDATGNALPFTVIFEFAINAGLPDTPAEGAILQRWAQAWIKLSNVAAAEFNPTLEVITEQFINSSVPQRGKLTSFLGQLRTNEVALGSTWQLREFQIDGKLRLASVTVKQTPADSFRSTNAQPVGAFVNQNEPTVLREQHVVPLEFGGKQFLGGQAMTPFPPQKESFWNAANIASAQARHKFSLNTCNGCHGAETGTLFSHVGNAGRRDIGVEAKLSAFLQADPKPIPDPVFPDDQNLFHSFPTQMQRINALSTAAGPSALQIFHQPTLSVH